MKHQIRRPTERCSSNICRTVITTLFLVIGMSILLFITIFPPKVLLNNEIIVTDDYPANLYGAMKSRELLSTLTFYAEDPALDLPIGILLMHHKLFTLVSMLLFFIPIIPLFKWYMFLILVACPVLLYFSGINYGLRRNESFLYASLAALVIVFEWQFGGMIYWGLNGFLFSIVMSLFAASYLSKYYRSMNGSSWLIFFMYSLLAVLIHTFAILMIIVLCAALLLKNKITINEQWLHGKYLRHFILFMGLFIILLFILLYHQILIHLEYTEPSTLGEAYSEGFSTLQWEFFHDPIRIAIFALGTFSIIIIRRKNICATIGSYAPLLIFLFVLSYFGSYIGVVQYVKPHRYACLLTLLLLMPISNAAIECISHGRRYKRKIGTLGIMTGIVLLYMSYMLMTHVTFSRQISTELPKDTVQLIDWIIHNTGENDTLLMEGSSEAVFKNRHVYGGHILYLFPYLTNRSYIAHADFTHQELKCCDMVNFYDGRLNGKKLSGDSKSTLSQIIYEKNIDWIVVWTNSSKVFLQNYEGVALDTVVGRFSVYKVYGHTRN